MCSSRWEEIRDMVMTVLSDQEKRRVFFYIWRLCKAPLGPFNKGSGKFHRVFLSLFISGNTNSFSTGMVNKQTLFLTNLLASVTFSFRAYYHVGVFSVPMCTF